MRPRFIEKKNMYLVCSPDLPFPTNLAGRSSFPHGESNPGQSFENNCSSPLPGAFQRTYPMLKGLTLKYFQKKRVKQHLPAEKKHFPYLGQICGKYRGENNGDF